MEFRGPLGVRGHLLGLVVAGVVDLDHEPEGRQVEVREEPYSEQKARKLNPVGDTQRGDEWLDGEFCRGAAVEFPPPHGHDVWH